MNLNITINLDNDSFAESPEQEVIQVLLDFIQQINNKGLKEYSIHDTNDNIIGSVTVSPE